MAKNKEETSVEVKPVALNLPVLEDSGADWSGETIRIPRLEVPEIRVSYKMEDDPDKVAPRGEFVEYNPATKESNALGKKLEIQVLHHRQQVSLTTDTDSYRGFEINMKEKEYSLFHFGKDQNGKRKTDFIAKDSLTNLRTLSPLLARLRYERVMYVLHEGQLKKLSVYGASFSQFLEFMKSGLNGKSSTSVKITLTTGKEKKGSNIYYPIIFTAGDAVDMASAKVVGEQLAGWFAKYDSLVSKQQTDKAEQASIDRGDGVDMPPQVRGNLPPARKPVSPTADNGQVDMFDEEEKTNIEDVPF